MPKFVQVRELKNQTTRVLRRVERGDTLVVTRRGKPIATLKKVDPADLVEEKPKYDTSIYDHLCAEIEERHPELKNMTQEESIQLFERISKKMRRRKRFKTWQEAERWAKGDRWPEGSRDPNR